MSDIEKKTSNTVPKLKTQKIPQSPAKTTITEQQI